MRRYDLIIFDFDGTLADSFAWFWRILPEVTAKFRLRPIDAAQRDKFREMPARAIMAYMGVRWWQAPAIAQYARRRMDEEIDTIALFDGIREMLATLQRAGVRLAVVSSNSEANVRRVLGAETSAHIEHFGCGAPILGKKGRTRRALKGMGTAPQRTLCIGDELRDADVAKEVGAHFAAVGWGYTLPAAFRAAGLDEPFASPEQIVERVLGTG
jgi:phosphoglycolate phosphatase